MTGNVCLLCLLMSRVFNNFFSDELTQTVIQVAWGLNLLDGGMGF